MKHRPALAVCLLLVGCGSGDGTGNHGGGFQPEQTCGLRIELSGALVASYSGSDTEFACAHPIGPTGMHTGFLAIAGDLKVLQLDVDGIEKGATGDNFAAEVRMTGRDERAWGPSDCNVDVKEHAYVRAGEIGDQYRVVGSGQCGVATSSGSDGETVDVGPFEFVTVTTWIGTNF